MVSKRQTSSDSELMNRSINRREYVAAVSAAATGLLAGCQSNPSGGDTDTPSGDGDASPTGSQELGERVPKLTVPFSAGLSIAQIYESAAPEMTDNWGEIGLNVEMPPRDFITLWNNFYSDTRNVNMYGISGAGDPLGISISTNYEDRTIKTAGVAPGSSNHYANCEFTMLMQDVKQATSREELGELFPQVLAKLSEDIVAIPFLNYVTKGAYRSDQITSINPGQGGVWRSNPGLWQTIETKGDTQIITNTDNAVAGSAKPTLLINEIGKMGFDPIYFEPLTRWSVEWELTPGLATDWSKNDDATQFTFNLREDAVFHDGEPITAEDVKWTYEYVNDNVGLFPSAQSWPYESIEAVDDHTVEFNFTQPSLEWIYRTTVWGTYPKHVWEPAGAVENPREWEIPMDPYVGSGPWKLVGFQAGQTLQAQPFEDHWNTPTTSMTWQVFQDYQSITRAFREGELNVFKGPNPSTLKDLEQQEYAEVVTTDSYDTVHFYPHMAWGPTKFRELRMAMSQALNRERIAQIATFDVHSPWLYGTTTTDVHPLFPDNPDEVLTKIAETPQANPDVARQVLRDQGWGWDDEDRLHYPPDADLSPLWPKGESPRQYPEKWPCVEELNLTPVGSGSS